MKTIYKYPVRMLDDTVIIAPITRFLTVDYQKSSNQICVWAEIDLTLPDKKWLITCWGTGHTVPERQQMEYIGTYQMFNGEEVGHFYAEPYIPDELREEFKYE